MINFDCISCRLGKLIELTMRLKYWLLIAIIVHLISSLITIHWPIIVDIVNCIQGRNDFKCSDKEVGGGWMPSFFTLHN